MQIAYHVSTIPTEPLPPFLSGLMIASWPIGVAGVIFALLDICTTLGKGNAQRTRVVIDDEPEIPEAPMQFKPQPAAQEPQGEPVSYFHVDGEPIAPAPVQPQAPPPHQQQQAAPAMQTIFATPPPFQQGGQSSPAAMNATVPLGANTPARPTATPEKSAPQQAQPAAQPQNKESEEGLSFFKL